VFVQLAREVRLIARLLNDYLRETDVNNPLSPAATEHAREADFADARIADPVLHILVRAQHGLIAAADHMLGLAACIEAEDVVLALISLLRPIVTAAGTSYHLLAPDISLRERLRRGWNIELDSLREQLNSTDKQQLPKAYEHVALARDRYLAWGSAHGFERQTRNERFGEKRYWLTDGKATQPPPSDMKLAEAVLAAFGDGSMGRTVYRFTSSFIHTQAHAFTMFLPAGLQYDPQTPNAVSLGLAPQDLVTWLMVATMAVDTAAARCGRYFGWDLTLWITTTRPILTRWSAELRG